MGIRMGTVRFCSPSNNTPAAKSGSKNGSNTELAAKNGSAGNDPAAKNGSKNGSSLQIPAGINGWGRLTDKNLGVVVHGQHRRVPRQDPAAPLPLCHRTRTPSELRPCAFQAPFIPSGDGHLGQDGHLLPSPSVRELINSNQNQKSKIIKTAESKTPGEKVPKVPILPKTELITNRTRFAEIAAFIRSSASVALDVEIYGPRKGDGLNPWAGYILLLWQQAQSSEHFILRQDEFGTCHHRSRHNAPSVRKGTETQQPAAVLNALTRTLLLIAHEHPCHHTLLYLAEPPRSTHRPQPRDSPAAPQGWQAPGRCRHGHRWRQTAAPVLRRPCYGRSIATA